MTTDQMERMAEDLKRKGLYVSDKDAVESLKQLRAEYSDNVSLEKVREITGRIYKKHRKTLSDEVKYVRRG